MTITIAIWAIVDVSRACQNARKAGILIGSGSQLTPQP
jgi:hypothetical protein